MCMAEAHVAKIGPLFYRLKRLFEGGKGKNVATYERRGYTQLIAPKISPM